MAGRTTGDAEHLLIKEQLMIDQNGRMPEVKALRVN